MTRSTCILLTALVYAPSCRSKPSFELSACGRGVDGLSTVATAPMILLGEMHGMKTPPAFAGDLACRLAATGHPVALALEIPASEQPALDAYLASGGSAADRSALLAEHYWKDLGAYGMASEARLELVERVRRWRQAGLALRLVAFDSSESGPDGRDVVMARNILAARLPGEQVVVLVGNLHARTRPGAPWDPAAHWMGIDLHAAEPALVALDSRYPQGSAWYCESPTDCGTKVLSGNQGIAGGWGVERAPSPDEAGYDGVFQIGAAEPSRPAVQPVAPADAP